MRIFRFISVLAILGLLTFMSFVTFIPGIALSANGVSDPSPYVLQGHSPVDLLLIGPGGQEVGCMSEPCMFSYPGLFNVVNNFSSSDGAFFLGTTGLGQEQELGPETIFILNPPVGTYTVDVFPSCTYYDPYSLTTDPIQFIAACSPGASTSIKAQASFTITMCSTELSNLTNGQCPPSIQIKFTGDTSGYCSPTCGTIGNVVLSINSTGGITIQSFFVTPEFPLGTILGVLAPMAAIGVYVLARKKNFIGSKII